MSAPIRRRRAPAALLAAITTAATVLLGGPVAAAPPLTPVLVGPTDGGTTSSTAPTLSVTATDPDGGAVPVRFEGRKLGATTPAPGTGDPFTLVALPDTQNYTYGDRQATIPQQTEWIASTRTALKTAFVVQLGDLVSDWFNPQQWQYISDGLRVLDNAGIPNSVVPGNHDFDNVAQDVGPYDTWFPVSRYANASWNGPAARYGGFLGQNQFGADAVDRRNMDNYSLFTAGGRDFLVLNLEWEAPQYALDWAHRVLTAYPDRLAIMVTHSFVTVAGGRRTTAERTGGTPTATLWSDFVAQHCSIRVVLSGHEHSGDAGEARRTDTNSCGNPVPQILTDYQSRANGGDGWLRYYTFDPAANTMQATTYSPKLGTYETDADSAFTLPLDLGTSTPAPFTTIGTTSVTSEQTASVRWTGLDPDTRYEWRAVAGATGETATSPVWTLRTPAAVGGVNDTFTRALTGGWGSADTGQRWSTVTASAFSVDGTRGRFSVPAGNSRRAQLDEVSLRDVLVSTDVAVTPAPTGSGVYFSLQGRSVSGGQYRAKLRFVAGGAVTIGLIKVIGGVETALSPERPVGTVSAGAPVNVQLELTGSAPTALRAKAWPSTTSEPTGWTATGTDSTAALQGPGAVGLETYVSSSATAPVTVAMDRFFATDTATPPPVNQRPTAVIRTPTITERTVTLTAADSTDPDGTITGWAWNFGDGTTATGQNTNHTYTADGNYPITLTVTDNQGATDTATRTVTVAATPPPMTDLAADTFSRTVSRAWGTATTGGSWKRHRLTRPVLRHRRGRPSDHPGRAGRRRHPACRADEVGRAAGRDQLGSTGFRGTPLQHGGRPWSGVGQLPGDAEHRADGSAADLVGPSGRFDRHHSEGRRRAGHHDETRCLVPALGASHPWCRRYHRAQREGLAARRHGTGCRPGQRHRRDRRPAASRMGRRGQLPLLRCECRGDDVVRRPAGDARRLTGPGRSVVRRWCPVPGGHRDRWRRRGRRCCHDR
ncbi:PKD domain-containing protein [Nakamurella sp. A5-74]|uniref:PKD domain-containing protein n=1 Tax=Nakamurella sp. A5-74 TaxID=3158264 RepID=A0AAU8DUL8_9ACTN